LDVKTEEEEEKRREAITEQKMLQELNIRKFDRRKKLNEEQKTCVDNKWFYKEKYCIFTLQ
jgi:hypothetical protein